MNSLTDVYQTISAADAELLEKQAAHIKQAEEEDAAGRIMARGFMDELHKLAQEPQVNGFADTTKKMNLAPSVQSKGYAVGGGATGPSAITKRPMRGPAPTPNSASAGTAPKAPLPRARTPKTPALARR